MNRRFLPLILALSLLVTTGCSSRLAHIFKKTTVVSSLPASAIVTDGPNIQKETVALLQSAHKSIYVEQSLFDDPALLNILVAKAHSGVDVKVLLDQWQSANKQTLDSLKNQNISVQFYPARKGQNDHVKLLVVDQSKTLVYGPSWTPVNWQAAHDIAVELTGYSAWWAASVFGKDWAFTTTLNLGVPTTSNLPNDHITLATNANLKQQITAAIQQANKTIWVESAEISDQDTVQALLDAAGRGKDIRLILDPASAKTTPLTIKKLKTGGVKIRYFNATGSLKFNLHAGIFDNNTFILTSSDWTYNTFVTNHEFSITVPSPAATAKLTAIFNQDWSNASPA